MAERTDVTEEAVRTLAALADLPLAPGREAAIASQLAGWLTAANELSAKLAAAEHQTVTPVTAFTHPGAEELADEHG